MTQDLSVIQKAYDLVLWFVPILNRFPRDHHFLLGNRIITNLYDLLEGLVAARFERQRRSRLEALNGRLDLLRYQIRLCLDLKLMDARRYAYAAKALDEVGRELGGWLRQQAPKTEPRAAGPRVAGAPPEVSP